MPTSGASGGELLGRAVGMHDILAVEANIDPGGNDRITSDSLNQSIIDNDDMHQESL